MSTRPYGKRAADEPIPPADPRPPPRRRPPPPRRPGRSAAEGRTAAERRAVPHHRGARHRRLRRLQPLRPREVRELFHGGAGVLPRQRRADEPHAAEPRREREAEHLRQGDARARPRDPRGLSAARLRRRRDRRPPLPPPWKGVDRTGRRRALRRDLAEQGRRLEDDAHHQLRSSRDREADELNLLPYASTKIFEAARKPRLRRSPLPSAWRTTVSAASSRDSTCTGLPGRRPRRSMSCRKSRLWSVRRATLSGT